VIAAIVGQFGHPQGMAGGVAGWVMARRPSNRQRNSWVVSLLDVQPNDRVLEIGFGPGLAIAELSRRVGDSGHVYGIDHSEVMLRQATRRNASAIAAGRVSLSRASVDQLPPSLGGPFDAILTVNSLGIWPAPTERLDEPRRRLRPGGHITIASQPRCQGPRRAPPAMPPARSKPCSRTLATPRPGPRPSTWTLPWSASSPSTRTPLATAARQRQTPHLEAGAVKGIPQIRDRTSVPAHLL
jgi:SAM-dependent methyltransferase